MTAIRTDSPTPNGGDYSIAVYVRLATLEEVAEEEADGLVVTEYLSDGTVVQETVATALAAVPEGATP